jgi:dUTP pyrophosphatase
MNETNESKQYKNLVFEELPEYAVAEDNFHPQFKKVPFYQYYADWCELYGITKRELVKSIYDNIKLPLRGTSGSAGYDFYIPHDLQLSRGENIVILTGIRAKMPKDMFLSLFPRSGQGFKYRIALSNTVGIIDSDYFNANNYGHIMIKISYDGIASSRRIAFDTSHDNKAITILNPYTVEPESNFEITAGTAFAQGIFTKYELTSEEIMYGTNNNRRTGGFGSTNK